MTEDMAVDLGDNPASPPLSLPVTQMINTAQAQHGLRHSDYARYRWESLCFCSYVNLRHRRYCKPVGSSQGSLFVGNTARESSIGCTRQQK